MAIKVSIISPTRDLDSNLLCCAQSARLSAIQCTGITVEHIFVIDGGNCDDVIWETITGLEVEKYKVRKITLVENRGVAFARNVAVHDADGDYLMFLDSDDAFEPLKITEQIKLMKQQNANFSCTGFIEFSSKTAGEWTVEACEKLDASILRERCPVCTSSVCLSRDWLDSIMDDSENIFPDQKMRSDWLGWFKLAGKEGFHFAHLPGHYVRREISANSLTANKFKTVRYNYLVFRQTGHSLIGSMCKAVIYPLDSLKRRIFPKIGRRHDQS